MKRAPLASAGARRARSPGRILVVAFGDLVEAVTEASDDALEAAVVVDRVLRRRAGCGPPPLAIDFAPGPAAPERGRSRAIGR